MQIIGNRIQKWINVVKLNAENQRREQATVAMENRKQTFDKQIEKFNNEYDTLLNELNGNSEHLIQRMTEKGKEFVYSLDELKVKAENLVNVIGNTGMSGGYQKVANDEARSKKIWRLTSVGALLLLVLILGIDFYSNNTVTFTIEDVIRRLTITATLGTLSTYAARQASKHEEAERYNRRMELELASIDLYLTGIPEATAIKKSFTDKFFGNDFKVTPDKDNELPQLMKALSEVAASLQQFMKKDNKS